MLRRSHVFALVSFCVLLTCYWLAPSSQSQTTNHSISLNGKNANLDASVRTESEHHRVRLRGRPTIARTVLALANS